MNAPFCEDDQVGGGAEFVVPWYLNPARALILTGSVIVLGLCTLGIFLGDSLIVISMLAILALSMLMLVVNVFVPWIEDGIRNHYMQKQLHDRKDAVDLVRNVDVQDYHLHR